MKKIMLSALLVMFVSMAAWAANMTYTWKNATTNTDGSAIPTTGGGSIASTRIEYGTCNGLAFGVKVGEVVTSGPVETAATPNVAPGTYCSRAYNKNTYGNESGPTLVVQKVIDAPTPNPPSNFSQG